MTYLGHAMNEWYTVMSYLLHSISTCQCGYLVGQTKTPTVYISVSVRYLHTHSVLWELTVFGHIDISLPDGVSN